VNWLSALEVILCDKKLVNWLGGLEVILCDKKLVNWLGGLEVILCDKKLVNWLGGLEVMHWSAGSAILGLIPSSDKDFYVVAFCVSVVFYLFWSKNCPKIL